MPGMSHKFIGKYYYYYLSVLILPTARPTPRAHGRCRPNPGRNALWRPLPAYCDDASAICRPLKRASWPCQRLRDWGRRRVAPSLLESTAALKWIAGRAGSRPNFTISHLRGKRVSSAPSRAFLKVAPCSCPTEVMPNQNQTGKVVSSLFP